MSYPGGSRFTFSTFTQARSHPTFNTFPSLLFTSITKKLASWNNLRNFKSTSCRPFHEKEFLRSRFFREMYNNTHSTCCIYILVLYYYYIKKSNNTRGWIMSKRIMQANWVTRPARILSSSCNMRETEKQSNIQPKSSGIISRTQTCRCKKLLKVVFLMRLYIPPSHLPHKVAIYNSLKFL